MIDFLQIGAGVLTTLAGSSILWLVKTISKSKSDLDIAFIKIRHLEEIQKELKDAICRLTGRQSDRLG